MALHDRDILRTMACGIAGLFIVADPLSQARQGAPDSKPRGVVVDSSDRGDRPSGIMMPGDGLPPAGEPALSSPASYPMQGRIPTSRHSPSLLVAARQTVPADGRRW